MFQRKIVREEKALRRISGGLFYVDWDFLTGESLAAFASRRELPTTMTEEAAMARPSKVGGMNWWVSG
jgi:hypothetical protein